MTKRRVTVSLSPDVVDLMETAAARVDKSVSAFVAGAVRREALRVGAGVDPRTLDEIAAEAAADLDDAEIADEGFRAAG